LSLDLLPLTTPPGQAHTHRPHKGSSPATKRPQRGHQNSDHAQQPAHNAPQDQKQARHTVTTPAPVDPGAKRNDRAAAPGV
jgi:hypothetical protein